nr:ABC transporter permease [Pseudomarimonas arenosa]
MQLKLGRELAQMKGQIAAIATVLAIGIAMWVMSISNYQSLSRTQARFYAEYDFGHVFTQLTRAPQTLLPAIAAIPGVARVHARISAEARLQVDGYADSVTARIVSLPMQSQDLAGRLFLRSGAFPQQDDEVLLIEAFADAHDLRRGDQLYAVINGRQQRLQVAGIVLSPEFIYPIRPGDVFPDFARYGVLWMRHEPLARAFDMFGAFNDLSLSLQREARSEDVIEQLDRLLDNYGNVGAHGRELQVSDRFLSDELQQLQVMARLFGGIFLGVAAFLLNIVLARMLQSQRELIGLLKAFGYRGLELARHYGGFALAIAVAGALPGLLLGAWMGSGLARLYAEFYRFPYLDWQLSPGLIWQALLFALLTAATGAAAAVYRCYRLPPAEAMRPEPPPRYHRSVLESPRLLHWLDLRARMILRTLVRRPWRSALSVFGIGLAAGILIMSRFQAAAVEHMVNVQFGLAQRDDLSIILSHPRTLRFAEELATLPGVMAVEVGRTVPVKLRNGHRQWQGALTGLPASGQLRRVLNNELQPINPPEHGLLLTGFLAASLALRVGDEVEVEVLDGARQRLRLPLAGTVDEYLGVSAYSERNALNRWLGEDALGNRAWVALAEAQRGDLLEALRARPVIASISDRQAMVSSFRRTLAEGILTFTLIASLMAASVAIGVVYNAARITLAERGRELASLRVLGYTRQEVRALLQGELLSLSLLALLPGIAIGYALCAWIVFNFQSELYRIPLLTTPAAYGLSGLIVLSATAASMVLVRRRLDGMDLIEALKARD